MMCRCISNRNAVIEMCVCHWRKINKSNWYQHKKTYFKANHMEKPARTLISISKRMVFTKSQTLPRQACSGMKALGRKILSNGKFQGKTTMTKITKNFTKKNTIHLNLLTMDIYWQTQKKSQILHRMAIHC